MAFDTPARIAIVGAGPIGLEAALYARFLGYDVDIYEQGAICQHVRRWQNVALFTPFGMNCSTLGLAALAAQDPDYRPMRNDQIITGREWIEQYLLPLSQTDLIADHVHAKTKVVAIGRQNLLKTEAVGSEERNERGFRILVQTDGKDENKEADIVIDASGVLSQPNWIGGDGAPAVGEVSTLLSNAGLPPERRFWHTDFPVGIDQSARFANKSILVLGSGHSAATTISQLAELARIHAGTKVTWVTRHSTSIGPPIRPIENDQLALRVKLAAAVNQHAASGADWLRHVGGTCVESIEFNESQNKCRVRFAGESNEEVAFDQIFAHVGHRPNLVIFRELQVHLDCVTERPVQLTTELASASTEDLVAAHSAESLLTTEPNFYVLGAKSYGRNSSFLYSDGLKQIRQLFAVIVDRAELDLYTTSRNLLPKS